MTLTEDQIRSAFDLGASGVASQDDIVRMLRETLGVDLSESKVLREEMREATSDLVLFLMDDWHEHGQYPPNPLSVSRLAYMIGMVTGARLAIYNAKEGGADEPAQS
jgi:hypothetical protein